MVSPGLFADDDDGMTDFDDIGSEVDKAAPETAEEISPANNPDLFGHESVEKSLLADFSSGRMPHAIILAGAQGIGKMTLAYRLGRFLLSQGGGDAGAGLFGDAAPVESLYIAPDHPVFRRVASGGHADLLVIAREFDEKKGKLQSEISVETVRRITPFLRKTAAEGGWRVVIIDSAEYLNRNSQNALLKILEEPPGKTVLILTTSQPGGFLPTIRSRCRLIPVNGLSEKTMGILLDKMAPGLDANQKSSLTRLSEGSIGKALQLHQDGGLDLYRAMLGNIEALPEMEFEAIHALAEKVGKYGAERSYEICREILTGWCGRLARTEARGQKVTDVLPGDAEIFQRLLESYPPRHFLLAWEKIAQLFQQAEWHTLDKKQTVITAFMLLKDPHGPALNI